MRFRFDPEHDELREVIRRLLAGSTPGSSDARVAARLAGEIGVHGLGVPERLGGAGFGMLELGVVFQEAGRAALDAPLLSPVLAADLLLQAVSSTSASGSGSADAEGAADLLALIAAGALLAAPAIAEGPLGWDCVPATSATLSAGGWTLTGIKDWVQDGVQAGLFVVSAAAPDGPALFTVRAGAPGLAVEPVESIDLSRRFARVRLDATPAAPLPLPAQDAAAAVRRTRDKGLVLLSADGVGVAQRCLEMATAWARQREQFGQVIGSFQAIKHKLASVRLELEAAESACLYALWAAQDAPSEFPTAVRIAAYTCGEAALLAAGENIQVHGGIGVTWEHPAHVYLRRATVGRRLLADPQALLEDLAQVVEETVFVSTSVPTL